MIAQNQSFLKYNYRLKRNTDATLIKIRKKQQDNWLFGAYSDGELGIFNLQSKKFFHSCHLYKNTQIIDFDFMDDKIVSCTHSEVTVHSIQKNKALALKGHQYSPLFLACHPISPLVLSCSNLLILHDLRIGKPINVNFITPPAFSLEYFPDGQFFLLSGEPIRIGDTRWVRTLMNGMGRISRNGKFVLTNQMNGKISLWDWRDSKQLLTLQKIANQNVYQNIYFGHINGKIRKILFLDQESDILNYDIVSKQIKKQGIPKQQNSKLYIREKSLVTNEFFRYDHTTGIIENYELNLTLK